MLTDQLEPPENFALVCQGALHDDCACNGRVNVSYPRELRGSTLSSVIAAGVYRSGFPGTRNMAFMKYLKLRFR